MLKVKEKFNSGGFGRGGATNARDNNRGSSGQDGGNNVPNLTQEEMVKFQQYLDHLQRQNQISEEIILYYYPHNVLLIILSLFTQCIIPKLTYEIQGEKEWMHSSVKNETKVGIGDEWQGQDSAVILLHIRDEFYTIAPSLLLHSQEDTSRESSTSGCSTL